MRLGLVLASVFLLACGSGGGDGDGGPGDGDGGDGDAGCFNLQCRQVDCPTANETTSVSGVVTIPSGQLPLSNVIVYVPNAPLAPVGTGVSCDRCDDQLSGSPLVRTTTNFRGEFRLDNVPVGDGIPLVMQIGKWRRQVTLPFEVQSCVDNPVADDTLTRLPARHDPDNGDNIPRHALTTGGADALECLLLKAGIDPAEFTTEAGSGRINFYAGEGGSPSYNGAFGGTSFTGVQTFWDDQANLDSYDVILLSCEGTENPTNKSTTARQNMENHTDAGGRVFASHWHNFWIENGPDPLPQAANFNHLSDLNDIVSDINTSIPEGVAMADWLNYVVPSSTYGKLPISAAQHTVESVDLATRWIYLDDTANGRPSVQYLSFNTPLLAPTEQQCGKMVLSDIHVSADDAPGEPFPDGCNTTELSPQEAALVYMLFDIAACVGPPVP